MKFGMNVKTALFSQHSTDQLVMEETVFQSLSRAAHPEVPKQEILGMAGALLFSGDDIEKKVRVLSGGEKTRVALGQVLLSKASLLLLDEPTNHLDFDTVEALTSALAAFEGSLITVSHDRSFIRRIATKVLEVHDGVVTLYPGTYDDYVWSLQKGVLSERGMEAASNSGKKVRIFTSVAGVEKGADGAGVSGSVTGGSENAAQASERRARLKVVESDLRRLEKSVPSLEKKAAEKTKQRNEINQKLVSAGRDEIGPLVKEMQDVTIRIEHLEEQLLEEMELLENLQAERKKLRGE
jgi:ATP-binding cassette subfamily F protein 3